MSYFQGVKGHVRVVQNTNVKVAPARISLLFWQFVEAWPEEAIHVKLCGQDVVRKSQGALSE